VAELCMQVCWVVQPNVSCECGRRAVCLPHAPTADKVITPGFQVIASLNRLNNQQHVKQSQH
jgi:hypothetical protein